MKVAQPGQIDIAYKDVKGGAKLTYKTSDIALVAALHKWFDAQISDHGKDAAEGHVHRRFVLRQSIGSAAVYRA